MKRVTILLLLLGVTGKASGDFEWFRASADVVLNVGNGLSVGPAIYYAPRFQFDQNRWGIVLVAGAQYVKTVSVESTAAGVLVFDSVVQGTYNFGDVYRVGFGPGVYLPIGSSTAMALSPQLSFSLSEKLNRPFDLPIDRVSLGYKVVLSQARMTPTLTSTTKPSTFHEFHVGLDFAAP